MDRIGVVLSPDLGITAEDLVDAWNASGERRTIATAEAAPAKAEQFEPVSLTAVLVGIAAGVATNILSELIKKALETKKPATRLDVREVTAPDGTRTLVVTASSE